MHVDWATPWLCSLSLPAAMQEALGRHGAVAERLNAANGGQPCAFVDDSGLPADRGYEQFIRSTGTIPTRDNLHDFFNGVVWLRFPRAKARINELHVAELARPRSDGRRGPVRDALTVFDENGAALHAPPALWDALTHRQWHRLFVDLRPLWREARLVVFGHALLEQLATAPRKPLTAHVLRADAPPADAALDGWLAGQLADARRLAAKPFTPLPVLGVPGWWPASEDAAFYGDTAVFRPARGAQVTA
ncbi:MAG: DUF3025 domain-containing protein [Burkholderiales bacterium]|nr:DUF3025 domain-containing protein [Burkholderiales bacterium]